MSVVIRNTVSPTVTTEEQELLQQIHAARRYPVCRFELRCSWEEDLISTALDAVHLTDANESMESVKSRAALLKSLEEKGLLVLFYDLKTFVKSDYQLYHDSAIFLLRSESPYPFSQRHNRTGSPRVFRPPLPAAQAGGK